MAAFEFAIYWIKRVKHRRIDEATNKTIDVKAHQFPPRTLAEGLAQRRDNFLLIRLIAAAMVIYGHGYAVTDHAEEVEFFERLGWGTYSGTIAVDAFFLISGFMITGSYLRRSNIFDYLWARTLRLVPAYVICVFGCAFVLGAFLTTLPLKDYFTDPATRSYALVNMHFGTDLRWDLPGVFTNNPRRSTINGSLWTLPAEVRMYLWVGLLGLLGILSRRRYATFVALALIAAGIAGFEYIPLVPISMFLRPSGMFALGSLCFLYRNWVPVNLALTAGMIFTCWVLRATPVYPFIFALAMASFVFCFAYRLRWFGYNRFGDYSYGLYLWGFPVQQTAVYFWPTMSPLQNVALSLPIALSLGILSWYAIEKPALRLKRIPHKLIERAPSRWRRSMSLIHERISKLGGTTLWGKSASH
ncbi:MAG: acyltransferase [Xanthomonadales bacterium]|nr:acyltransferase [Xanthomonadales bacterium]